MLHPSLACTIIPGKGNEAVGVADTNNSTPQSACTVDHVMSWSFCLQSWHYCGMRANLPCRCLRDGSSWANHDSIIQVWMLVSGYQHNPFISFVNAALSLRSMPAMEGSSVRTAACWLQHGTEANGHCVEPHTAATPSVAAGAAEPTATHLEDLSAQGDALSSGWSDSCLREWALMDP